MHWARDARVEAAVGPDIPGAAIDAAERETLRMEIEAIVAHDVFGLTREEFEIVLDSFTQLAATEQREQGEYRTKRLALAAFDERVEAIATGRPYQTRLDPSPADPRVAHPPRVVVVVDSGTL
jgi:hypothetical protein